MNYEEIINEKSNCVKLSFPTIYFARSLVRPNMLEQIFSYNFWTPGPSAKFRGVVS